MVGRLLVKFGIVAVACVLLCLIRSSPAETDTEYWSKYAISVPMTGQIDLLAKPEFRFEDTMSRFYYWKVYVGPNIHASTALDIAAYYTPKAKRKGDQWQHENLGDLDGTLKWRIFNLELGDRNRLEYSFDEKELTYRNRLKVGRPAIISGNTVTFFVADEIFYHLDSGTLNENRGLAGISAKIAGVVHGELSVMHRTKEQNGWRDTIVVTTTLGYNF